MVITVFVQKQRSVLLLPTFTPTYSLTACTQRHAVIDDPEKRSYRTSGLPPKLRPPNRGLTVSYFGKYNNIVCRLTSAFRP